MAKVMKIIAALSFSFFAVFFVIYQIFGIGWALTLTITFATTAYHFIMRLAVGTVIDKIMRNRADYTKKRYQLHPIEQRFYEIIKVRRWKNNMPTYQPDLFSPKLHTWHEIAQAMCQAEVVHETIVVLSFLPIFASIFFGALPVFAVTSVCAALYDSLFIIMQRYNRPRVVKLAIRQSKSE